MVPCPSRYLAAMAGGPCAAVVVCMDCLGDNVLTQAVRVQGGTGSDRYRCTKGHVFGINCCGSPAPVAAA